MNLRAVAKKNEEEEEKPSINRLIQWSLAYIFVFVINIYTWSPVHPLYSSSNETIVTQPQNACMEGKPPTTISFFIDICRSKYVDLCDFCVYEQMNHRQITKEKKNWLKKKRHNEKWKKKIKLGKIIFKENGIKFVNRVTDWLLCLSACPQ